MGCIKAKKTITIKTIESIKDQVFEQQKLISTYESSSQYYEFKASSNSLPINDKNVNKYDNDNKSDDNNIIIISEKGEKSQSENSSEKKSYNISIIY